MPKAKLEIVYPNGKTKAVKESDLLSPIGEVRMDSWKSLITGLGTSADKRTTNFVTWDYHSQEFFEQLYSGDELASRIVDLVPEDALRKPWEFTTANHKFKEALKLRCDQLNFRSNIEKTWKWGRAFGGALLYVVTDTNKPDEPMRQGERVLALRDLSRYDLRILTSDVETDFGSDNYGQPIIYYLNVQVGSQVKLYPIHWSRCIRFDGKLVPRRTYIRNNYWHDSVLQRLFNVIRNYQSSNDAAAMILQDFNTGIYKMKNLAQLMSAGKEDIVKKRIELLNYSKSVIRALVLDSDTEDYQDLSRNVTGLDDLLRRQAVRLVAATDIPHTKLLGESPDGSNATGNSTTSQWYDYVQSEQENYLRPKLKALLKMVFYDVPEEELGFKFQALWQLDELQQADLRNKQAQTDQIYLDKQVLDPTEIADSRFGGETYSYETKLDLEARAAGLITSEDPDDDGGGDDPGHPNEPQDIKNSPPSDGSELPKRDADESESPGGTPDAVDKAKAIQAPRSSETEWALPQSLQAAHDLNPKGLEAPGQNALWSFRNNEIPDAKEKVKPFISQTESLPFLDPKTDPRTKTPGKPNTPRSIDFTGENNVGNKEGAVGNNRIGLGPRGKKK